MMDSGEKPFVTIQILKWILKLIQVTSVSLLTNNPKYQQQIFMLKSIYLRQRMLLQH